MSQEKVNSFRNHFDIIIHNMVNNSKNVLILRPFPVFTSEKSEEDEHIYPLLHVTHNLISNANG